MCSRISTAANCSPYAERFIPAARRGDNRSRYYAIVSIPFEPDTNVPALISVKVYAVILTHSWLLVRVRIVPDTKVYRVKVSKIVK